MDRRYVSRYIPTNMPEGVHMRGFDRTADRSAADVSNAEQAGEMT
jgi:hypothetical protein